MRHVQSYAKGSGYMSVEDGGAVDLQSEVGAASSDHDVCDALAGSEIVKRRTAAIEAANNRYNLNLMWHRLTLDAMHAGLRNFTEEEYQQWRAWRTRAANKHFHAIKIQQDKDREKLTDRTRRRP